MDDVSTLVDGGLALALAHKWWLLAAMLIGGVIRLSKPDVNWWVFRRLNVSARWRPLAAAALGVIAGMCQMLLTPGADLASALKWGVSAAFTAMLSHTFVIETARNGRELGEPASGPGRKSRYPGAPPRPPTGDDGDGGVPVVVDDDFGNPAASAAVTQNIRAPLYKLRGAHLLSALLLAFALSTTGCAGMLPVLTTILRDASDAALILDAISQAEQAWFAAKPQPEVQTNIELALTAARLALSTALRATEGAKELTEADRDKAFDDFRAAYTALHALLQQAGIVHDGTRIAVSPTAKDVVLPEPLAMRRRS